MTSENLIHEELEIELSKAYEFLNNTNIITISPLTVGLRLQAKKSYRKAQVKEYLAENPKATIIPDYVTKVDEEELVRYMVVETTGYIASDINKLLFSDYSKIVEGIGSFFDLTAPKQLEE